MTKFWRHRAFRALIVLCALPAAAHATSPTPPCAGAPAPAYAAPGEPPQLAVFHAADLDSDWPPDACANLPSPRPALLIAMAGRFVGPRERDALLTHIGAISARAGIRYWSVTDRCWEPLVTVAHAISTRQSQLRRPDFTAEEMKGGHDLYFAQQDNRSSSAVIFRMRIRDLTPGGFVVESENVSPVRYSILTIYAPGDLRSDVFLREDLQGNWDYYALTAIGAEPLPFGASERSYVNRALAMFRHIAGIATDLEPPAAP